MRARSEISTQLRERRRELGLTLAQLARRSDTSAATLSRYETGWNRFEVVTLRKLATALDCELVVRLIPKVRESTPRRAADAVRRLGRLFWDVPLGEEHLRENPVWVVERVLEYGQLDDVESLVAVLGREPFLRHVGEARFSSNRTRGLWEAVLEREGKPCTRRFSRREAATSWRRSTS